MEILIGNQRRGKIILVGIVVLIVALFIGLLRLITGSLILSTLIFIVLMYFLLRAVGIFVMYPGSSCYTRSDIEMRMSKQISSRMVLFFNSLHFLHLCIAKRKYVPYQNQYDFVAAILVHNQTMQEVLGMFQDTLSKRKIKMLNHYKEIETILYEKQGQESLCLKDFVKSPGIIDNLTTETSQLYKPKLQRIQVLMKELHGIIKSYSPPDGTFSLIKFRMFQQNLYEMRFAFHTWSSTFNYELFYVKTTDDDTLETTIIHNFIRKNFFTGQIINKPNQSKKTVLFCNPNGVFIQFFGFDSQYIKNYLKMGYNVVLWNYRGYGQSTGSPTIIKSQIDSSKVFDFYRQKGYDIQVVHGYSIGGAAAVGLFDKVPQEKLSNVQILIIDRSFSSVGEMSVEFGSALHSITKLLFIGDNIDLSKQFESVRCRKLLIWDKLDEVIPDRASVKNRIIKRKRGQSRKGSMYGFDEDLEVNQLNEDDIADPDFENLIIKLAYTIKKVLAQKLKNNNKDQEKTLELQENSTHVCAPNSYSPENIDHLVKIINEMDGGGIELLSEPEEMQAMLNRKPQRFNHLCESYVLGIACYGSYFPLGPFIHDHKKIKDQTLLKLQRAMLKLKDRYNIDTNEPNLLFQKDDSFEQLVKNMYHIFFKISHLVTDHFSEEWFSSHGSLLPTNNGHNSSLTELEIRILNDFISFTAPEQMQQMQELSDEEEQESQQIL